MLDRANYEKITDDIMVLANKFVLKMNVALSFYNNDNKRINFHREVEYYSQKAYKNLINIRRTFDYYLSIENIKTKDYVRISITDMLKLQYGLEQVYKFFTDSKYQDVYAKKDGELIIYRMPTPIVISGLTMDKYLQFEPCIYVNFRGETEQGVRMYLSSQEVYCDISLNRLEGFIYIINNINLFESAQAMLAYIERPELGYNLFSYNTEPMFENEGDFAGKDGREVKPAGNVSYFDKMRNLE